MIFDGNAFVAAGLAAHFAGGGDDAPPAAAAAYAAGVLLRPGVAAAMPAAHCRCRVPIPARDMPDVVRMLSMAVVYFGPSFRDSAAYRRILAGYTEPVTRAHWIAPPPLAACQDAWEACAAHGVYFGHCEAGAAPHTWFYCTPPMRKFLRALGRHVAQKGGRLQVCMPRACDYLALPRPAAIRVVVFHSVGCAWRTLEVFARRWRRPLHDVRREPVARVDGRERGVVVAEHLQV